MSLSWDELMRQGDFASAWQISDADMERRKGVPCWHLPRHFQYIWKGESLAGKIVLVRCYHGLGDTIQFIRYMPLLKQEAAKVIVWAQDRMIPLLKQVLGIDEWWPLHDGTPEMPYDADVELMELPHYFRTTIDTIPNNIPYLQVEAKQTFQNGNDLNIGLVWRSGDWDESRSLPFELVKQLGVIPAVQFHILQADAVKAGWDHSLGQLAGGQDLLEDARIIKGLDLVISTDTMVAHLAGALGVPVWTLLPNPCDWRWMNNRTNSPWYPTMRLFRQEEQGDWQTVINQVKEELLKLTHARHR
jgi:hypothetical protein